jgi:hypothetical protein
MNQGHRRTRDKHLLTCEWCSRPFYAVKWNAKYHDGRCQRAAYRHRDKLAAAAQAAAQAQAEADRSKPKRKAGGM